MGFVDEHVGCGAVMFGRILVVVDGGGDACRLLTCPVFGTVCDVSAVVDGEKRCVCSRWCVGVLNVAELEESFVPGYGFEALAGVGVELFQLLALEDGSKMTRVPKVG